MKKFFAYTIIFSFLLTGCASGNVEPESIIRDDFDLSTAIEMIQELEEPLINFPSTGTITRSELDALQEQYTVFREDDGNWLKVFISANDEENPLVSDLRIAEDIFVPTLFHQEIDMTEAYIEQFIYDEEYSERNHTNLYIIEKYSGTDEKMKSFSRTYHFSLTNGKEWKYEGFSGAANLAGEGYFRNYLSLKQEY